MPSLPLLKSAAALLALTSVGTAEAATAARKCVSGSEVASLFVYSMPAAVKAVKNSCEGKLRKDGFLVRDGAKFSARYTALQDETWPKARRALLTFAAGMDKGKTKAVLPGLPGVDPLAIAEALPDHVARPLVETLIMQKVTEQVKPDKCVAIERVLWASSPFDPKEAGTFLGSVMGLVGMKELDICQADGQ